ncbi:glutathione S-transferase family protein [Parvibaculum sp. MBR-TMA-1.3b-4.2]|jgi:glutathione S-transferase
MLEIYRNEMSTCSQKVRLALAEKGVEWRSRGVNLIARENKTPEFLALNSDGVVPVLEKHLNQVLACKP